jgi:hypothetical protein
VLRAGVERANHIAQRHMAEIEEIIGFLKP